MNRRNFVKWLAAILPASMLPASSSLGDVEDQPNQGVLTEYNKVDKNGDIHLPPSNSSDDVLVGLVDEDPQFYNSMHQAIFEEQHWYHVVRIKGTEEDEFFINGTKVDVSKLKHPELWDGLVCGFCAVNCDCDVY